MMNTRAHKLAEAFLRIVHQMMENQKKPRHYGIDELLYPSEIHTIMMIGMHRDVHVSELARFLGVTRGAVSQMVAKLEGKGLIEKKADPKNGKIVLLSLTTKGKVAYYAHEQYHEEADAPLIDYMANLTEEQYAFAVKFLEKIEEMVNRAK